ncbi:FK506-binding protein 2-like [Limulus polyphemus]|uniref:peptidylprolyl isomerase n=1 Tax=Limulus polyphemus TaxID=6850 RepID=A0ABM1BGF9_LIMPO|nr:FK506-binding protein 2-like [Limulus polyphemus]
MRLKYKKIVNLVRFLRVIYIILLCLVPFTKSEKEKTENVKDEQEVGIQEGSEQLKEDMSVEFLNKPEKCDRITKKGDLLTIHYKGTLEDGEEFDSSYNQKEPFQFQLGIGQVIQGWDIGLTEMCIGEKRRLTIPSNLAYGESGAGVIFILS